MTTFQTRALIAFTALAGITAFAASSNYAVTGVLTYEAKGPTGKFKGANNAISGGLVYEASSNSIKGKICSDQNQWKSGEGLRDGHTRDMFEVDKFKTACLEPASLEGKPGDANLILNANLTMHGVTKPIKIQASVKPNGDKFSIDGQFSVKLTDFDMKPPSLLGITVANDVNVIIKSEASAQ